MSSKNHGKTFSRTEIELRLICLSDAAETEGGAVVHIGQKLDSGTWSSQLLAAKSKILYVTDSTIALSWCHNSNIELRLFVYTRVMTILRMCE